MKRLIVAIVLLALLLLPVGAMATSADGVIKYGILRVLNRSAQTNTTNADVTLIAPVTGQRIYLYRLNMMEISNATGVFTARMAAAGGTTVQATLGRVITPLGGIMYPLMSAMPHVEISEPGALLEVSIPSGAGTTAIFNFTYKQY